MIDFRELPDDGTRFEQLVRELLLTYELSPRWTGQGPDQGRDLIATETATGPIGTFNRIWLVSCKHYAHSGRAVGRQDVASVVDDCRQAKADGFLLVCSTHPSSGTIQKLSELAADRANRLTTAYWDSVELEKRLLNPTGFSLAHQFFPESMRARSWRIYNAGSPSFWAAHFKSSFFYLASRKSTGFPPLEEVELIFARLSNVVPLGENQNLRLRAVYFDDKNEQFYIFVDYLVPQGATDILPPGELNKILKDGDGLHSRGNAMWYVAHWDVRLIRTRPKSDSYQLDHRDYYEPHLRNFRDGVLRHNRSVGELISWFE